jgi:peptide/nickel transport system permease protein
MHISCAWDVHARCITQMTVKAELFSAPPRPRPGARIAAILAARLAQALLVALAVGILTFAMMEALPGDAAFRIAAGRYGYDFISGAAAEAVRAELGLDRPLLVRLSDWLGHIVTLDLGRSLVTGAPVTAELTHQLGHSLRLAVAAVTFSLVIAIPVGTAAGLNPGGRFDRASLALSIVVRATPAFALGVALTMLLAVHLRLLPVAGYRTPIHLTLPALTLALGLAAVSSRIVRDAVAEIAASDQARFARLKGLSERIVLLRHVARNAAIPVVAYVGVQLVFLIEGVVVVETLFAWPGIGHALVHAIFARDVPMVQGTALALGLVFVALNAAVDLLCRLIDPRGAA